MDYKEILQKILELKGMTAMSLSRELGYAQRSVAVTMLSHERPNRQGVIIPNGMNTEALLKYLRHLGATMAIEWTDPNDMRKKYRWVVDRTVAETVALRRAEAAKAAEGEEGEK